MDKALIIKEKFSREINIGNSNNIILMCDDVDVIDSIININSENETNVYVIYMQGKSNIKSNITFNLKQRSKLNLWVSNLNDNRIDDNYVVNLDNQKSEVNYYQCSFLNKNNINNSLININHIGRDTISKVRSFFVLKNESSGFVRCVSDLKKGCVNSNAAQELRLVVLDEKAKANSDPVLIINENDIAASHANAIGMIDKEQIFYMQSRGLTKDEAETLIITGYFVPLIESLKEINEDIASLITDKLTKKVAKYE